MINIRPMQRWQNRTEKYSTYPEWWRSRRPLITFLTLNMLTKECMISSQGIFSEETREVVHPQNFLDEDIDFVLHKVEEICYEITWDQIKSKEVTQADKVYPGVTCVCGQFHLCVWLIMLSVRHCACLITTCMQFYLTKVEMYGLITE